MKSFYKQAVIGVMIVACIVALWFISDSYAKKYSVREYMADVLKNGLPRQGVLNDLKSHFNFDGAMPPSPAQVVEVVRSNMPDLEPKDIDLVGGWEAISLYQRKYEVAMVVMNARRLSGIRIECGGVFCEEVDIAKFLKEVIEVADAIKRLGISDQELRDRVYLANYGAKLTQVLWLYPVENNLMESPKKIAEYASWFYQRIGRELEQEPVINRFKTEAYARRAQYLIHTIQGSSYPRTQHYEYELQQCLKDGGLILEDFRVNKAWLEKAVGVDPRFK